MTETQEWTPELYAFLYEKAEAVAYSIHRDFSMVEVDDLVQEALMWAVEHPDTLAGYLENDPKRTGGQVYGAMRNVCKDYAVAQRAFARGDEARIDDAWYTLDMLKGTGRSVGKRGLLHLVFDDQAWTNPEKVETESRTKRDPAEGNNWLATLSDVSAVLDKLTRSDPEARKLIELHYKHGYTYEEIGPMLEPPVARMTVGRRMDRAIKKVQEFLGGPAPRKDPAEEGWQDGPGTRYVITNAAARAITDNAYDE